MIVDLSKTSVNTMKDVLAMTEAPVIFSHSSAFELCNSSRNVQDEILELVAKNRGLVMVNFYSKFLSCSENSTVYDAIGKLSCLQHIKSFKLNYCFLFSTKCQKAPSCINWKIN